MVSYKCTWPHIFETQHCLTVIGDCHLIIMGSSESEPLTHAGIILSLRKGASLQLRELLQKHHCDGIKTHSENCMANGCPGSKQYGCCSCQGKMALSLTYCKSDLVKVIAGTHSAWHAMTRKRSKGHKEEVSLDARALVVQRTPGILPRQLLMLV